MFKRDNILTDLPPLAVACLLAGGISLLFFYTFLPLLITYYFLFNGSHSEENIV